MEEIDLLRIKNLQLLDKLKKGQSQFRNLVEDSNISITSDYNVQPNTELNRRIEELSLFRRPVHRNQTVEIPELSIDETSPPYREDSNGYSLENESKDFPSGHVIRNTSTPTFTHNIDSSDDNGEPQTSTPREYFNQSNDHSSTDKYCSYKVATPKSILKNRKLIDDNISLDNSSLYKYKDLSVKHSLNDSSLVENRRHSDEDCDDSVHSDGTIKKDFELLREITNSPKKNVEFFQRNDENENNSNYNNGSIKSPSSITVKDARKNLLSCRKSNSSTQQWKNTDQTLLGYDWISDVQRSKSDSTILKQGDEYFNEMSQFRKKNKAECETDNPSVRENRLLERAISPEIENPSHTCIHGYTINDRLFAVPTNADAYGRSVCTVCLAVRKPTNENNPGFMRVSVPKSQINADTRIKPHRRNSFDPSDSCALSQHTVSGYESKSTQFISLKSSTMDLKHAVIGSESQQVMTSADIDAELEEHSRSRKLGAHPDASSRIKLNSAHIEALNQLKIVD